MVCHDLDMTILENIGPVLGTHFYQILSLSPNLFRFYCRA